MLKIIVNKTETLKNIMILEDDKLVEKYDEEVNLNKIEGNIYIGKIEDVLPGMQAAFVDIGEKQNALIQLKDILQQELNKKINDENIKNILKPGMKLLVQVKKENENKKGAKLTTHFNLPRQIYSFTS